MMLFSGRGHRELAEMSQGSPVSQQVLRALNEPKLRTSPVPQFMNPWKPFNLESLRTLKKNTNKQIYIYIGTDMYVYI